MIATKYPIGAAIVGPLILLLSPLMFRYMPRYVVYVSKTLHLPLVFPGGAKFLGWLLAAGVTFFGILATVAAISAI